MKFTDVFIHRPVLASVVSLFILVLGLRALGALEIREYPETKNTVITISTIYPGASSEVIQGFITQPLQQAVAEADGIDFITASSTQGRSVIEAQMELNYDPKAAVAEIQAKVASQRGILPQAAEDPVISSSTGQGFPLMFIATYSESMGAPQITDYLLRDVIPRLQAVPGVAQAGLQGGRPLAMRVWLDPERMASLGITAGDVAQALTNNNFLAGVGQSKGAHVAIDLTATTDISSESDFRKLVVRRDGDTLVRLDDIAVTVLGADNYSQSVWYRGTQAVGMAIEPTPGANPLVVAQAIHDLLPDIRTQLPGGVEMEIAYDGSEYIQDSITEVFRTLFEAVGIVLVVIFVSLGTLRASLIPAVAVPLSLIGGAFLMLLMGFSLNLLTLLAFILAIGLVVDDAIVVVENIHRHIEEGERRLHAALKGARELGMPIIAMTTTLIAVYAPIGFMGGLVGTLFTEFAFALAGAVVISGVVALTLSPVLCSRVLKRAGQPGRFERGVENFFNGLADRYQGLLHRTLDYVPVTLTFSAIVLASIYFMFATSQNELAPTEDQGFMLFNGQAPETATLEYDIPFANQIQDIFESFPEYRSSFLFLGAGGSPSGLFGGMRMKSYSERDEQGMRSLMMLQPVLQQKLSGVAGFQTAVFSPPSLPGSGGGLPVEFVINGSASYEELDGIADEMIGRAMQSGNFIFLQKSISFDRPKATVKIDRDRAGLLGIDMANIGTNLAVLLGEGEINRFSLEGRSYKVIPQVAQRYRLDPAMLDEYYIRNGGGQLVPMSTFISYERSVEPAARTQFQQLNSVTLQGIMRPGVSLGAALDYLAATGEEIFPRGVSYDYAGTSRQYVEQGSALVVTFFMALIVIYLVLAAQFESWRDPLIILVAVPMTIAGALAFITLGFATINIYTQVGLITLIGLIAKNGILIVEFANQLQIREGLDRREAVERAAGIRLRPILMTTAAMIMAMVPLLVASGPGAVSRFHIGLVIASGLGIGTIFTLFIVPAFYLLLARRHRSQDMTATRPAPGPA